eukprot:179779_1
MNVDDGSFGEEEDGLLLVIGFIKQTCKSSLLLTFPPIIEQIQLFYDAVEEQSTIHDPTPPPQAMDIIHEARHPLKRRNSIEPSIRLIHGYIRTRSEYSLSSVISDLIYSFYTKMNGTSFVWRIDNKSKLLSKLLSANDLNHVMHFDSDVFEVTSPIRTKQQSSPCNYCSIMNGCCSHCKRVTRLSLKYYLAIFPNGTDLDTRGEFQLKLNLVSIPSILQSIRFIYSIHCHQLNSSWCSSAHHNRVEGKITTCDESVRLMTNDIKALYEVHHMDALTFYITLDIVRLKLKNDNKSKPQCKIGYNPRHYFDDKQYMEEYKDSLFSKFEMINDEWKFNWSVPEEVLTNYKKCNNIQHRLIVSDIFYDRWCLTLHHVKKKIDEEHDTYEDIGTVGLRLCALPSNISSIVVQIKLFCVQSSCSWSAVRKFDEANTIYRGQDIMIGSDLSKLTVQAHVMVIEAFDVKGNEMSLRSPQQQQGIYDPRSATSIGYKFEPHICGDSFKSMRCYYQHIGMAQDGRFESISNEEIHNRDTAMHARKRFGSFDDEKRGIPYDHSPSDLQRIGTQGWHFKPVKDNRAKHVRTVKGGKKKVNKLYYQHICIERPFVNKQNEELRFEDMFKKCASKESSYNMVKIQMRAQAMEKKENDGEKDEKIDNVVAKINEIFDRLKKDNTKDSAGSDGAFKRWYDKEIGYDEYYEILVENGWNDMEVLDALTDEDLIKMKIHKQGHRVKILRKIDKFYNHKTEGDKEIKQIDNRYDLILKIMAAIVIFSVFCNTFLLLKH